jgi:hypothetical protein
MILELQKAAFLPPLPSLVVADTLFASSHF